MVNSPGWRKYSGWLGVVCVTMIFMSQHHAWVKMTRTEFGITDAAWQGALQYIIGITLMGQSIACSVIANRKQDKTPPAGPVSGT